MADSNVKQPVLGRRQFVGSALAASALAALAGCSSTSSSGSSGSSDSSSLTVGDNYMLFYLSEPSYIDPYNAQENQGTAVVRTTFDTLLTWDFDEGAAVPLCAASLPEISDDGLTYTFTLREGMTFHNGDAVDAASFKRAWERLADPTMASPSEIGYHLDPVAGYAEMAAGEADEISGVVAVDELTLQVTLTAPMADFTAVCCHPGLAPVPQAALDDPEGFLEQPIGNGPFKLDDAWQHNQYILASRFDDYYGDAPSLDGVYFSIQADPDTAYREFEAGNMDFASIPTGQIEDNIETYGESEDGYTSTPGHQVINGETLSTYYLVLNLNDETLSDVNVRRAISCAINRQNIVDTLFEGTRSAANSIMPLTIDENEANEWDYCEYDPDLALEILDEAGIDPSSISIELSYNSDGDHEDIMSSIQSDLESIGISVTQSSTEWATYLTNLSDGNYQIGRLGWIADYPTQDNFLYPNFYSTADNNYGGYNNAEVDAALLEARQIEDDDERREAYRTICATIGADLPVIPIMFYTHNYVASERMESFMYDSQSIPHFETAVISA